MLRFADNARVGRNAGLPLRVAVLVLLAPGCASSVTESTAPWAQGYPPFADQIAEAIDEARDGGASADQIAILEWAQKEGEVMVEMMRDAVANVSVCFEDAGGTVQAQDTFKVPGVVWPNYVVGFDESIGESQIDLLVKACDTREYRWVSSVFQTQPVSREALGQYVLSQEPVLRACLEDHGILTDPDANGWDLAMQAAALDDVNIELECLAAAHLSGL